VGHRILVTSQSVYPPRGGAVLTALLAIWSIAVGTVGELVLVAAARAGQVIFEAHQTAVVGRTTTIRVCWFQLHPALELLTAGLSLVSLVGGSHWRGEASRVGLGQAGGVGVRRLASK
jgi:hypothetical protein